MDSNDIHIERRHGMIYLTIGASTFDIRAGHLPDSLQVRLSSVKGLRSEEMQVNPVMANVIVVGPSDREPPT